MNRSVVRSADCKSVDQLVNNAQVSVVQEWLLAGPDVTGGGARAGGAQGGEAAQSVHYACAAQVSHQEGRRGGQLQPQPDDEGAPAGGTLRAPQLL